jgi:hypothetical protein
VPHLRETAKVLGCELPEIDLPSGIPPRTFAFDTPGHRSILLKFANRRLHRSSETLTNRWIGRFERFKSEPLKFATEAIPKLARRLYAR